MKITTIILSTILFSALIFVTSNQETYGNVSSPKFLENTVTKWTVTGEREKSTSIVIAWSMPLNIILEMQKNNPIMVSVNSNGWLECEVLRTENLPDDIPNNIAFFQSSIKCDTTEPITDLKLIVQSAATSFLLTDEICEFGEEPNGMCSDQPTTPGTPSISNPGSGETKKKKGNGGCADCTPPTIGLDTNYKRVVEKGFGYNGNMVDVDFWYTEFPKIIVNVGEENLLEVKVYENNGISNMKWIQACFGATGKGMPLDECEALVTIHLETNGTNEWIGVEKVVIVDKDNLLDNESLRVEVSVVDCHQTDLYEKPKQCAKLELYHTFLEAPLNNMVIINVADKPRNPQNFHFNHGVEVHGESLNGQPTITLFEKHSAQDVTNNWNTYIRDSKVNDTWTDEYGIQYQRINDNWFERITPLPDYVCKDKPLDQIMNGGDRMNCHWRAAYMPHYWTY